MKLPSAAPPAPLPAAPEPGSDTAAAPEPDPPVEAAAEPVLLTGPFGRRQSKAAERPLGTGSEQFNMFN